MFKFELESVLSLREKFEDSKKRALGAAIQEREKLTLQRLQLEESKRHTQETVKEYSSKAIDCTMLRLCGNYTKALEQNIQIKRNEEEKAEEKVEEKRQDLLEAVKARKILENLKNIKKEQYHEEEKRIEANRLDEIVTYKCGTKKEGE